MWQFQCVKAISMCGKHVQNRLLLVFCNVVEQALNKNLHDKL